MAISKGLHRNALLVAGVAPVRAAAFARQQQLKGLVGRGIRAGVPRSSGRGVGLVWSALCLSALARLGLGVDELVFRIFAVGGHGGGTGARVGPAAAAR